MPEFIAGVATCLVFVGGYAFLRWAWVSLKDEEAPSMTKKEKKKHKKKLEKQFRKENHKTIWGCYCPPDYDCYKCFEKNVGI